MGWEQERHPWGGSVEVKGHVGRDDGNEDKGLHWAMLLLKRTRKWSSGLEVERVLLPALSLTPTMPPPLAEWVIPPPQPQPYHLPALTPTESMWGLTSCNVGTSLKLWEKRCKAKVKCEYDCKSEAIAPWALTLKATFKININRPWFTWVFQKLPEYNSYSAKCASVLTQFLVASLRLS